jgi:hypothetical protein
MVVIIRVLRIKALVILGVKFGLFRLAALVVGVQEHGARNSIEREKKRVHKRVQMQHVRQASSTIHKEILESLRQAPFSIMQQLKQAARNSITYYCPHCPSNLRYTLLSVHRIRYNNNNNNNNNLPQTNHKGLVAWMIHFVHKELHALHLTPGLTLRPRRRALLQARFAAKGLIRLHGFHHGAHTMHGLIVGRQTSRILHHFLLVWSMWFEPRKALRCCCGCCKILPGLCRR